MNNEEFDKKIKNMQDKLQVKGKVYFYIRVSSLGQVEDSQFLEIENFCKKNNLDMEDKSTVKIYHEKITGTKKDRPQLQEMLKAIGKNDLLVIYKLDRLSRNYKDCIAIWEEVLDKGADIHVITQPLLDTRMFPRDDLFGYLINQLMLNIFAYFAQQETELRAERAAAGYKAMKTSPKFVTMAYKDKDGNIVEAHSKKVSKKTGNVVGRPVLDYPKNFATVVQAQQNKEMTMSQALSALGIKKSSYYKLIKKYEQEHQVSLLKK